jgi:hypothetical protein
MRRFDYQRFIVVFAVSLFVAGPVAACLCTDWAMADMSCCPDGAMGGGDYDTPDPVSSEPACEFVPGNPIPASSPDLPVALLGASTFPVPAAARAPPLIIPAHHEQRYDSSPPIYLLTLRIRD